MADIDREQIGWQLRAVRLIEKLLLAQLKDASLPVLRWTLDSAGCGIVAEPGATGRDAREHAVRAWADHLNLPVKEGRPAEGVTNLVAHGPVGDVYRVVIHTTLYDDEEEGERG
ncbi:hypothetical protein [Nonomuraea basaltis]|uniref:hypothetical protein n=1 Tax=Nonomuraea basaltis TaxID=2495887 RepID=UPI00110C61D5|nr:hypothetical protein [Nonomuraea basaltis]TMS00148.1 hypothetical protein EJK15_03490 [Nonomuraea basaltis]